MKQLATEILHDLKKHCRAWQIATVITAIIAIVELVIIVFQKEVFMKRDTPIPNAPVFANLRNRGLTCIGIAGTEKGLERARSQGLTIFEPRLNYSTKEYNEIVKRRRKYNK